MLINEEEGGGHGSLKDLESELNTKEAHLADRKEQMGELQNLLNTVRSLLINVTSIHR